MTIIILWGTLFSLNRGVNALTRATIDIIHEICPDEGIIVIGGSEKKEPLLYEGVKFYPLPIIQDLGKLFIKVNIYGKKAISTYFNDDDFLHVSFVLDLSAGDSFTDIYGNIRFASICLSKLLFMKLTKKFILLPQTLGPFKNRFFEKIAVVIIKQSDTVLSRDSESKIYVDKISGQECIFCHDMAFALNPKPIPSIPYDFAGMIGINISGLLWEGGYTKNNQFGLKTDYRSLMHEIAKYFLDVGCKVVLIPHTYGGSVEDDLVACEKLKTILETQGYTVDLIKECYSEQELKWIISHLDFFVGSRMHSCIAALSTGVPAVGIAYSRKFIGVYESIGIEDLVLDPKLLNKREILGQVNQIYANRSSYQTRINSILPPVIEGIHKTMELVIRGKK